MFLSHFVTFTNAFSYKVSTFTNHHVLGFCNDEISLLNNQVESFCALSRCEERGDARQLHLSDLQRSFPVPRVLQILKAEPSTENKCQCSAQPQMEHLCPTPPQGLGSITGKRAERSYEPEFGESQRDYFLDVAGPLFSWTHNICACLCKTCTGSSWSHCRVEG